MPTLHTVAVIGAGRAGRSFAERCVRAGFTVVLEDVLPSKLRLLEQAALAAATSPNTGSLRFSTTVEDAVREADVVIDFVPDELESKLEIISMVDRMAPPRTMLCIPTNALSLTDLASCTYRAESCVAVRGDLSSSRIDLVSSRFTTSDTLATVSVWLSKLGYAVSTVLDIEEPMLVKNVR